MIHLPSVINGLRSKYYFIVNITKSNELLTFDDFINYYDDLAFDEFLVPKDSINYKENKYLYSVSEDFEDQMHQFCPLFHELDRKQSLNPNIDLSTTDEWRSIKKISEKLRILFEAYFDYLEIKY